MTISILGIDIAKNTFQLHGVDTSKLNPVNWWGLYEPPSEFATHRVGFQILEGDPSPIGVLAIFKNMS